MTAWRLEDDGTTADLRARHAPDRWDVAVAATLPPQPPSARLRRRLVHQIRQDLWRAAQAVRGFTPRVSVAQTPDAIQITAGGVILVRGALGAGLDERLASILADDQKRRRWLAHARAAPRGTRACFRRS
ncbi:MAG: hypothetical protein AAF409_08050 [Pseudomonadota bacterium]